MDKTTKYKARICEAYIAWLDVDVPDGENPHDYIERLCSNGEIDITHKCDDFNRSVEIVGGCCNDM